MDLTKMFDTQRKLDERIEKEHPAELGESRFNKKILSLLVELGECANEERSWKFWSKDQEPRTTVRCFRCIGTGKRWGHDNEYHTCDWCEGIGSLKNPLLEEFADCTHFVLGIGNDKGWEVDSVSIQYNNDEAIEVQFNEVFLIIAQFYALPRAQSIYNSLLVSFFTLGYKLGFTPEQIESAYYAKNKINHQRQEDGY